MCVCVKGYETDMRALRATLVFHAVVFMMHSKELLTLTEGEREDRSVLHTQQQKHIYSSLTDVDDITYQS